MDDNIMYKARAKTSIYQSNFVSLFRTKLQNLKVFSPLFVSSKN